MVGCLFLLHLAIWYCNIEEYIAAYKQILDYSSAPHNFALLKDVGPRCSTYSLIQFLSGIVHTSSHSSLHLLKSFLHCAPVNNIPNRTKILGLPVLILQIVCMLPSIDTQQRCVLAHDWVLVRICSNLYMTRLGVLHKPCPSTPLDTSERSVELGLKVGEISVTRFDSTLWSCQLYSSNHLPCIPAPD
jgi:hypothetical protein